MLRLYNTAMFLLRPVAAIWGTIRATNAERRREWGERRARRLPQAPPDGMWIHGSSMGEAQIARLLVRRIRRLRPDLPLAASAFTPTGRGQLPEPPEVDATFYMPLDFPGNPRRVIEALRPRLLGLIETELWPNLIRETASSGVGVAILNARLAPERMGRYRRLGALYRPLLRRLDGVAAQSDDDAERFASLGLPESSIRVTGNIKYDLPTPDGDAAELRKRFHLAEGRPVLVAGSTGAGEEPLVLDAAAAIAREHPGLYLVLAPRHPPRTAEVEAQLRARGLRYALLSGGPAAFEQDHDVLLVDTVGELARLYRLAGVAFVGGSLVPVGGHNLLEPAVVGVPVLYGPHTHHVAELASTLERAGGAVRVRDAAELGREAARLLADPAARRRRVAAATAVLERNRGALDRTVRFLFTMLDRPTRGAPSTTSAGSSGTT